MTILISILNFKLNLKFCLLVVAISAARAVMEKSKKLWQI
jgi:hypothetical protein